jgi:predicted GTPase
MAKIKLGNTPKNFKRIVKFEMLDGSTGSIEVSFKYRTRSEFGVFLDELVDAAGAKKTKVDGEEEKFSMAELMKSTASANAEYVMKVIDGWNLDEDLTLANVQQLSDELPAAVIAIMETYRAAINEGRLGN